MNDMITASDGSMIGLLIRCKECKWSRKLKDIDNRIHCNYHCRSCTPNGFCSEGEPNDDNQP